MSTSIEIKLPSAQHRSHRNGVALPLMLCCAYLILSNTLSAEDPSPAKKKPNILYILADQWRASATGYAGDPNVKTPHLDKLAAQGLQFVNAVSVLPVCTPHRSALMTGRFPTSTGMFLNDAQLPEEELCLAEIFKTAGYKTGYIGKWHMDGAGRFAYIPPERRQGFDYWKAAECDHNFNQSHYYEGTSSDIKYWEGYDTYAQTKDAQNYIREHAKNSEPFVLFIGYGTPHFPHMTAPQDLQALYPPASIVLPANVPATQDKRARQEAQGYYAHCTALDSCIGKLLNTLDETSLSSSTIVVFSSDHGEMLGAHDYPPMMKQTMYSEASSVPFLLRYPDVLGQVGRTIRMPLTTTDILPTLLGLAGIAVPPSVEGDDLSPVLRAGGDNVERTALFMNVAPFDRRRNIPEFRALRSSRYTYVRGLNGPLYLFDNELDPLQMTNLITDPKLSDIKTDLDRRLSEQLTRNKDDFLSAADSIALWGYRIEKHGSLPYSDRVKKPEDIQIPKRQK